jgi:hypothetical protein
MSHGSAPGPCLFAATTLVVGFPSCVFIRHVELFPVCPSLGRSRKNNEFVVSSKNSTVTVSQPGSWYRPITFPLAR